MVVVEEGVEERGEEHVGKNAEEVVKQEDHIQIVTPFLAQCLYEAQGEGGLCRDFAKIWD